MFSPLLLFWVIFYGKSQVNRWLYEYIRLALPRPINPDNYSFRGALRFEDTDVLIPEFEFDPQQEFCGERLIAQVRKDINASVEQIWKYLRSLTDHRQKADIGDRRPIDSQEALAAPQPSSDATDDLATFASSEVPPMVRLQNPDAIPAPQPSTTESAAFAVESQTVPIFGEGEPSLFDSVTPHLDDGEAGLSHNGYHSGIPQLSNEDQNHYDSRGIPNLPPQDLSSQTSSRPLTRQSSEAPHQGFNSPSEQNPSPLITI